MVSVKPWPRYNSSVIIVQDPLQTLNVVFGQHCQFPFVFEPPIKLGSVVFILPTPELLLVP